MRLTIGQVFPEWDGRTLYVSWKAAMAVLDGLIDAPPDVRDEISAQAVDGGEAVRLLLERAREAGTVFVRPGIVVEMLCPNPQM